MRVAAEPRSRGKGALVVLNDEINSARDVTKTDALRLQTFQQPDVRRARRGRSRPGGASSGSCSQRHTATSEFDLKAVTELPRVDVIMVYQGAPAT